MSIKGAPSFLLVAGCTTILAGCGGGGSDPIAVAAVIVSPAQATLVQGATSQLTATATDAKGGQLAGRSISWSSSAPTIAAVSGTGLVSAVSVGSATITATSEGRSGTTTIVVIPPPVATVEVSPAQQSVFVGGTVTLTATTKDANGATLTGRAVTWTSGAITVASVGASTGVVTGVSVGVVTITATSEGRSGTAQVTVQLPPVATVTVTPPALGLSVGGTATLTATLRDGSGAIVIRPTDWTSSAPAFVSVNSSGGITALANGSATITASSEGKSGSALITVSALPVVAVVVTSPIESVMALGRTVQLSAVARDANQNPVAVTFNWSSTQPAAATVAQSGLVSAVGVGTTTINVGQDKNGVTGSVQMRVVNANLAAVTATLSDAFSLALRNALSTVPANSVAQLLTTCTSHVASGNVLGIDRCLSDLLNVTGANGNDTALLGSFRLFVKYAQGLLSL